MGAQAAPGNQEPSSRRHDGAQGRRRTGIGATPPPIEISAEALIEREAVTVLCSEKGWIRAVRGHNVPAAEQKYKDGDRPRFAVNAETTDRLIVLGTNGRFYTIGVDRLPGGRGHGEPLRLMIDLPNEHDIVAMFPYRPGMELLIAASDGRGFVVDGEEAVAQTRAGKQVLTPVRERLPASAFRSKAATRSPLSATTAGC